MNRSEAILKVEKEFADKREESSKRLDVRIVQARSACPGLGGLLDTMAARFAKSTALVLQNRSQAASIAAKLKSESLKDRAEVKRLLTRAGFPETYLDTEYDCEICRDTGYVDQAHIGRCQCFERRLNELMFGSGDKQNSFESFSTDIYPTDAQRCEGIWIRDLCIKYADDFPHNRKPNLVLMGKSGLGKTFFLDSIHNRVMRRGFASRRITAFRMLGAMREYHFGEVGDDCQLNGLLSAPLLLIDDLGTEPMLKNITNEYLFLLVNERLYSRKPTVYATNLTPVQLSERYSERLSSRLLGKNDGDCILLQGDDLRLKGRQ